MSPGRMASADIMFSQIALMKCTSRFYYRDRQSEIVRKVDR